MDLGMCTDPDGETAGSDDVFEQLDGLVVVTALVATVGVFGAVVAGFMADHVGDIGRVVGGFFGAPVEGWRMSYFIGGGLGLMLGETHRADLRAGEHGVRRRALVVHAQVVGVQQVVPVDGESVVTVQDEAGTDTEVVVTTGETSGSSTEILSGLAEGDTVVVTVVTAQGGTDRTGTTTEDGQLPTGIDPNQVGGGTGPGSGTGPGGQGGNG